MKDFKEINFLKQQLKDKGVSDSSKGEDEDDSIGNPEELLRMKANGYKRKTPQFESMPMKPPMQTEKGVDDKNKNVEEQYNCIDCDFQGSSQFQLRKHINLKHVVNESSSKDMIKCRNCGEEFTEKWRLMNHRKSEHISSVALCRNNIEGNCKFAADMCWWNHADQYQKQSNLVDLIECYVCNETFGNKPEMMIHRKNKHLGIVRNCNEFTKNSCRFKNESCWYRHEKEMQSKVTEGENEDDEVDLEKEENEGRNQSGFQKVSTNPKPPFGTQKKNENLPKQNLENM